MSPFRLVIFAGCLLALIGGGYMSYFGVARESGDLTAAAPGNGPSARVGSGGGGFGFFGRVK